MATHEPEARAGLALGREDDGRLVSAEEYANADYVEPWKYERVEGRLVVMAPDGQDHNDIVEPWRDRLVVYKLFSRPGLVQFVKSEAWIRVDDGTDRIADLAVYLATDRPAPKIPDRVPEIIFEVVSPGDEARRRDYVEKRADYHRLGVREYVIIDRFRRRVTVLEHAEGGYRERVLEAGDVYAPALLPGLEIPLGEMLGG